VRTGSVNSVTPAPQASRLRRSGAPITGGRSWAVAASGRVTCWPESAGSWLAFADQCFDRHVQRLRPTCQPVVRSTSGRGRRCGGGAFGRALGDDDGLGDWWLRVWCRTRRLGRSGLSGEVVADMPSGCFGCRRMDSVPGFPRAAMGLPRKGMSPVRVGRGGMVWVGSQVAGGGSL
jgi:hypothetical protein